MKLNRIKVLVIDDSLFFREALSRGLSSDPALEVVGAASDPFEARDKIIELEPDVLTLDVAMPKMDGIQFLKELMPQYPVPVVVISSAGDKVFDALRAGAVDYVKKPEIKKPEDVQKFYSEIIVKIKIASVAKVGRIKRNPAPVHAAPEKHGSMRHVMIAIGASTGGPEAITQVIRNLPETTPGIAIVQHMPPVFTKMFAERLNSICKMEVLEAHDGDAMKTGRVLIAPGGCHMELKRGHDGYYVKCFPGEKVNGHCPSVDVLFNSFAACAEGGAVGVILTGMGGDGAKGLLNMKQHGAYTFGQDEKSSVVYGMPHVAWQIGAVDKQAPLDEIPVLIQRYLYE